MQVNLVDDVSVTTVCPETSSTKLTCTPCKTPKPKYQALLQAAGKSGLQYMLQDVMAVLGALVDD